MRLRSPTTPLSAKPIERALRLYPASSELVDSSILNWPAEGYTRANGSVTAISPGRQVKIYNGLTRAPQRAMRWTRWGSSRPRAWSAAPALEAANVASVSG